MVARKTGKRGKKRGGKEVKTPLIKALRAMLKFLNVMVRFAFGQDAVQLRNRIHGFLQDNWQEILRGGVLYVSASIAIPVIALIAGFICGWASWDSGAHAIMAVGFLAASLAWIILILGMSGFLKLVSIITTPFAAVEETVDLRYNPENVSRFFGRGFNLITWLVVATLYCSIIPIWNSFSAFILLIVITLFFITSVLAKWVTPDPRTYKFIWKIVFVLFILTTLRFLPDVFWVKITGHNPPAWFGFHYKETQKTIKEAEREVAKAEDLIGAKKLAPKVRNLKEGLKTGVSLDSLEVLVKEAKSGLDTARTTRNQESLPSMIWESGGNGIEVVKEIWPFGKKKNNAPTVTMTETSSQSNILSRYSQAINFCPQWTEVPPDSQICLVDLPKNPSGEQWRVLVETTGEIKLKDVNLNKFTFSGREVRRASSDGGQIFAYGNGRDTAKVKATVLY